MTTEAQTILSSVSSDGSSEQPSTQEATEAPQGQENQDQVLQPNRGEEDFSSRFAALSRREKEIREYESRIKEKESKYSGFEDLASQAKENPLAVMEKYGLNLDDIISASLGSEKPEPTLEDEVRSLKAQIEEDRLRQQEEALNKEKMQQEAEEQAMNDAIEAHKLQITSEIQDTEKYELINFQDAGDLVWQVTEEHFDSTQEVLEPAVAAEMVEKYLLEQYSKAAKLKKLQEKLKPEPEEQKELKFEDRPLPKLESKPTLSESFSSPAGEKNYDLSVDDSLQRAAALLKWK